jgi:hypothetical protein
MNERKGDSELIIYFERKTRGLPRMKITTSLPECGSYEFLFCAKGYSEDDARKVVEPKGDGYKDYDTGKFHHDIPFPDAVNSLGSLLKAKGMDVKKNYALIQNL